MGMSLTCRKRIDGEPRHLDGHGLGLDYDWLACGHVSRRVA